MRWRRPSFVLSAISAVILLGWTVRVVRWRPLDVAGEAPHDGFTRVAGVVHVHTTHSDGGGTPEVAIAAARAAQLSFLVITDHNNLEAKPVEGYHDGLLVLVGTEISTTAGHVLGLGIPDPVFRFSGDARDVLDDVRALGGFAAVAHPSSPREDFRWTGWDLPGPWGLELLNGDSQWRSAGWGRRARTAGLYALNDRYALLTSLTPETATLERWDALLRDRNVAGLAGADAHSRVMLRKQALRFPSYESLFALAQNHVLLEAPLPKDAAAAGRALVGALGRGRSYLALDALAPANGFSFTIEDGGHRWTMGDTAPVGPGLRLVAGGVVPHGARLTLLRDGQPLASADERMERSNVGPGVYRVEVRVPGWETPWLLTNPIYVFDEAQAAVRARHAAWPEEPPPPPAAVVIDAFDGATIFGAEVDPGSSLEPGIVDPHGGGNGTGAARLAFRLGVPTPGQPYAWCGLVNRRKRDLSGRQGLVFSIKADGVYRLWVQVRDENPASGNEGTEWWFASVRTSTDWRRVALPFSRFRSIDEHTDGRLDLSRVRALVFLVDGASVKRGTKGTIWLDELGAY